MLRDGEVVEVDADIYERMANKNWCNDRGSVLLNERDPSTRKPVGITLGAFVMGERAPKGLIITHLDGNKWNFKRENLAYVQRGKHHTKTFGNISPEECRALSHAHIPVGKSGYRGVSQVKNRFRAMIKIGGKSHYLGMFPTAWKAAFAYDKALTDQGLSPINFPSGTPASAKEWRINPD